MRRAWYFVKDMESRLASRVQLTSDRFKRPTNAFRKKIEKHIAALAPHHMHHNFCRVRQALRVTPEPTGALFSAPAKITQYAQHISIDKYPAI